MLTNFADWQAGNRSCYDAERRWSHKDGAVSDAGFTMGKDPLSESSD